MYACYLSTLVPSTYTEMLNTWRREREGQKLPEYRLCCILFGRVAMWLSWLWRGGLVLMAPDEIWSDPIYTYVPFPTLRYPENT